MSGAFGDTGQNRPNAQINVTGSALSTPLMDLLVCDQIQPGSAPSYQICKIIYTDHPLGAKLVDGPIKKAQSQRRLVSVPGAPDAAIKAYWDEWNRLQADDHIAGLHSTARTYGIASLALVEGDGSTSADPLNMDTLATADLSFNVLDPLNTSGSLVLTQDPNSKKFLKPDQVEVQGRVYHRSRTVVALNGRPIYIDFTNSAFGFVGRSVYQAALYPLKSFVQTMITDDMVARKNGLLIAKIKQAGSIGSQLMAYALNVKRNLLRDATVGNVLNIGLDESVETLDMQNVDGSGTFARDNILKNIAVAADQPAQWLNEETMGGDFHEGTEDARKNEQYVRRMRTEMGPAYAFMDEIVMRRAWTPEFYATVQALNEDFANVDFQTAFQGWRNAFTAEWPNLIEEPDAEKSKTEKVKFDAIIGLLTVLLPACDPENKALLFDWARENLNEQKLLFPHPLKLDLEALATYEPPLAEGGEGDGAGDGGNEGGGTRGDSVMALRNERHRLAAA